MRTSIVAEISSNHLGDEARAQKLVRAAAASGATHVKFQLYRPDDMVCDRTYRVPAGPWEGELLYDLYARSMTPQPWFAELFTIAEECGVVPFASVFHPDGVDYLEKLGCTMYKISSFELGYLDLIRRVEATGKHVVMSLGMASKNRAIGARAVMGFPDNLTLLLCTSAYPTPLGEVHLDRLRKMAASGVASRYGISDHTPGDRVPQLAVAAGASMVEKHFTLKRLDGGPDAAFSLEPDEFSSMVASVRLAEVITYGLDERQGPHESQESAHTPLLRRLWVTQPVKAGEVFTRENLGVYRGGDGILGEWFDDWLGRASIIDRPAGPLLNVEAQAAS